MNRLRESCKKRKVLRHLTTIGLLSAVTFLGMIVRQDLTTAKIVEAQQITKIEGKRISTEISPRLGECAAESKKSLTVDESASYIDDTIDKIKELKAIQAKEVEEKSKISETTKVTRMLNRNSASSISLGVKEYPEKVLEYADYIKKYATMFNVDPNVVASLLSQESGGNIYCNTATSAGIAQIDAVLGDDFIKFGKDYFSQTWTLDDRYNPAPAISYCCYRLNTYLQHYNGDYRKALQAYNFSHYSLDKLIEVYGEDWESHTHEMAYYNGHYQRTGSTKYGDPEYVSNVLGFYRKIL